MRSPIPDYLDEVLHACGDGQDGHRADYIPELAQADPDRLAVSLATVDGLTYSAGDSDTGFTVQSIAKPFVYALALADRGMDAVLASVGVEPSGEAFNELSLERGSGRPRNPMINAGALTIHALTADPAADGSDGAGRILAGLSLFAGRELDVDEAAYASEIATAHRNRAIAHMLRSYDIITADPDVVVRGYTRQCSVVVTTRDLAVMAATLANGGIQPVTGEQVVSAECARQVLTVMTSCGMYDGAGDWLTTVGIPAKSGVSGGIIGALPGQLGLAAFSPRLNRHGSSVRGVRVCQRLSRDMGLHLMEMPPPAQSVLRRIHTAEREGHPARVYELQGTVQFSGAERVLRALVEEPPSADHVVLDLSRVHAVNRIAARMLRGAASRLTRDGHEVAFEDPEQVLLRE